MRKEYGHSLPENIVEAGDNEDLFGTDDVVHEDVGENGTEQADASGEHYERREDTTDVRRRPDLLYFPSVKDTDFSDRTENFVFNVII